MALLDDKGVKYLVGKLKDMFAPKSHTHDDRYYTESEVNTKLNGKSNTGHTHDDRYYTESEIDGKLAGKANSSHAHSYAGSASVGGSANSAVKLDTSTAGSATQPVYFSGGKPTATTYSLAKSVPSDAKFTDTVYTHPTTSGNKHIPAGGSSGQYLKWSSDGAAAWESVNEANLSWGGRNYAGDFGCIDAAMIPDLGANRFAFGNAAGIKVEYSNDNGSTWTDYGADNTMKTGLFASGSSFYIGKATSTGSVKAGSMLRVTIDTDKFGLYTVLNKFAIYLSTQGHDGCYCTIDASLESNPTNFVTFANKVSVSGWSGWNIINTSSFTAYGNSNMKWSQYGLIRFTFGITSANSNYNGMAIYRIMGFGGVGWVTPSTMASIGTIYSYDASQNVTFPARVTASGFNGVAAKLAQGGDLSKAMTFNWSGKDGQPTWLWGGEDYSNMYVYNPSKFNVNSAKTAASADSAKKLATNAGSATQPVYFANGVPVATTYTLGKSVPSNAVFTDTNTWRGVQNNLTSDSTDQSLSAAQGKVLKALVDGKAAASHTHTKSQISDFPSSLPANGGNSSTVNGHSVNSDVPSGAKFTDTNTWRGIQNNLTSDSTTDSLSAAQGKALKSLVDGKAASGHTHTKSQITDFPSSLPASDVYAWAKAGTKPSYTKSEVGLGNVDNTADSAKSVKYATSAGSAGSATKATGVVDYGATGKTIEIGYGGSGISGDNIKYIAGYTTGDGSTVAAKIKDVSKDDLKSWIGLGSAAYSATSAFAPSSHTHPYAGAASSGGSATSAVKLDTSTAGSATQPVYFTGGKPTACAYTLGKSVPSNAVFTDTTYGDATTSAHGLMTAADKSKLNGIATGANKTVVDSTISQSSTNPVQNGVITKRLQFLYSFKISRDKWNEASDKSNWNVIVSWTNSSGTALTGSTTGTPNLTTDMSLGPAMMERTSSLSDNIILSGELSMINQGQIFVCDTNKVSFTVKRRPVCDLMLYFYARQWTT